MFTRRTSSLLTAIIMILTLSACAQNISERFKLADHSKDYLKSVNGPRLQLPAELNQQQLSEAYILPNQTIDKPVSLLPPGSLAAEKSAHAKGVSHV